MSNLLGLFGFLPEEQRDTVKFHFAKNISYSNRIPLVMALLCIGFVLQILFMNVIHGVLFLLLASLLMMIKGYDSRVRIKTLDLDPNWSKTDIDRFHEMEKLRVESLEWDRDWLDITNPRGFFFLVLMIAFVVGIISILVFITQSIMLGVILATDAVILVFPMWFTGMRFIQTQARLEIKVKMVRDLFAYFETVKGEGEEYIPELKLARDKDDKTVPVDARFSIKFPVKSEGLYGLQAQININVVQGSNFPYFYCVIAAKPGYGLAKFADQITLHDKVIIEFQKDEKAEVLVIRQHTTKKSGYHTNARKCKEIFADAIGAGRMILKDSAKSN